MRGRATSRAGALRSAPMDTMFPRREPPISQDRRPLGLPGGCSGAPDPALAGSRGGRIWARRRGGTRSGRRLGGSGPAARGLTAPMRWSYHHSMRSPARLSALVVFLAACTALAAAALSGSAAGAWCSAGADDPGRRGGVVSCSPTSCEAAAPETPAYCPSSAPTGSALCEEPASASPHEGGCCPDCCQFCGAPCCAVAAALASTPVNLPGIAPLMALTEALRPLHLDPDRPQLDPPPRA